MSEDYEEFVVDITEKGAALAKVAIQLNARGFTPDEIYDILELPDTTGSGLTKEQTLAVLMVMARNAGAFD